MKYDLEQELCKPALVPVWFWAIRLSGMIYLFNPPASKASREIANLTWRKNPHTHTCLWQRVEKPTFWPSILTSSLMKSKIKTISKKVCRFGCSSSSRLPLFDKKVHFWLNNYLHLYHLQGGMKFAPQILPLLNYLMTYQGQGMSLNWLKITWGLIWFKYCFFLRLNLLFGLFIVT